ncbi:DUF2510 domain-containing protein [Mycobacterium sp. E740]|uniref:DUF2510 domain-containing protein n=1 Tax=Mycobacterium sp. E740 TaxID=1834149 RepID=UPI0009ED0613|nr:DUF2510 domain-containing protein [Mycobacterium sp. E740]
MTAPDHPGWYDDPHDATAQRYWDGQEWTPHRQRRPMSPPVRAAVTPPQPPPPAMPPSQSPTPPAGTRPIGGLQTSACTGIWQ